MPDLESKMRTSSVSDPLGKGVTGGMPQHTEPAAEQAPGADAALNASAGAVPKAVRAAPTMWR
jgi:hypothetical protein